MFETKNNSSLNNNIVLLFNDFYNMFLNGISFENLVHSYIEKNLTLIYGKHIDYVISINMKNIKYNNIIKLEFNNYFFGYLCLNLSCDKSNMYLDLFVTYLSLFYYNSRYLKSKNLMSCSLFTDILNIVNDGIIITNEHLNIIFINDTSETLLTKIIGRELSEDKIQHIDCPPEKQFINDNICDIFSQLDEYINSTEIYKDKKINYKINKNNTDMNIMLNFNTIFHHGNKYNVITMVPVTSKDDDKNCQNIGFLSHELRNPLQTISFASELININYEQKYINIINKSVNDMTKIINDVLDIDRINSNQIQLNIEAVDIDTLVDDIEFSVPQCNNINFKIIKEYTPCEMYTDPTRLKQILLNIINNSIKYSKPDASNNIILKITCNKHNTIAFTISDTGIGIKKSHMCELTDLKPPLSLNKTNSNGIGLYLCNKLAGLLGGNIKINSEYLNFTEIIFTHPLNLTHNNNIVSSKIEKFKIYNKILIIDNDNTLLNLFKDILMNLKIKYNIVDNLLVDLCNNVNIIYDMVKLNDYDIIFLDLYMLDVNGITIAKLLRKQYYNNKIIGMTTDIDDMYSNDSLVTSVYEKNLDEEKVKIMQLYDDMILKPFSESDILDKLKY